VAELLAEQIECADVVVLTKMELVPREQRDFMRALLRLLLPPNAGSLVVPVESGADPSPHLAERIWIDSDWERTVKQPPPPPPSPLSPDPTW
jgi:G3E family GTPase